MTHACPTRRSSDLVGERVGVIFRLGEIAVVELALVGDDQAARLQLRDIGLERRGGHRDEHVGRVARGVDRRRTEIDLERRHAEQRALRSEEHTSELQSLMRISYAVFCLKKKKNRAYKRQHNQHSLFYKRITW